MRTVVTKIYKFEELSEVAKEKAREWYKDDSYSPSLEELKETMEEIARLSRVVLSYEFFGNYDFIRFSVPNEDCKHLTGKRAMAWLENNFFSNCNRHHQKYSEKQNKIINRSKLEWKDWKEHCNFTGVCHDIILNDVYVIWVNRIRKGENLSVEDFFSILSAKFLKERNNIIEYEETNEYVDGMLIINEYEFTEDGNIF